MMTTLISLLAALAAPQQQLNAAEPAAEKVAESVTELAVKGLLGDLGLVLLLAALATLLCKKLKQPVVLGYIIAGFLASPNFLYIPSISNLENIEVWAQVGIVVIMFSLGLEFSYRKLINSGSTAVITTLIIVTGMTFAGFGVGRLLHLDTINCIFLGGMISMSSTIIILKSLSDLGLRHKKFASLVLAVLIIEDLFAVLMLVILSSIAVGNVEGSELLMAVAKLVFFLIIWFVVGVYVLPSFLNRMRAYLNDEMLLVCALGLCFGMAIFSVACGFSLELGAFVMGSVLAGTVLAERIEKVVLPVKNLFAAVFFISVGMMVQPDVIVTYWWEILLLAAVVIIGMIIFGTLGMLVTGQSLKVAIQSGFTLTQIGEFSFIIASLGMGLGVLDASLYPIIVAVSVITIFTTPYFIKLSEPAYNFLVPRLPKRAQEFLENWQSETTSVDAPATPWKQLLKTELSRVVLFSVILVAIIMLSRLFLFPLTIDYLGRAYGKALATGATLVAMSPFIMALTMPTKLKGIAKVPAIGLRIVRFIIALLFLVSFVSMAYTATIGWVVGVVSFLLIFIFASKRLLSHYRNIEKKFMDNLNSRENIRLGTNNNLIDDIHQAYIEVGPNTSFVGDRLRDSGLRRDFGVSISSIQRGQLLMPLPSGDARIFPGDILGVIGTDDQIKQLNDAIESDDKAVRSQTINRTEVTLRPLRLTEKSPIVGRPLADTDILKDYFSMIVKVKRPDGQFVSPTPDMVLSPGDVVWVVGDKSQFSKMI